MMLLTHQPFSQNGSGRPSCQLNGLRCLLWSWGSPFKIAEKLYTPCNQEQGTSGSCLPKSKLQQFVRAGQISRPLRSKLRGLQTTWTKSACLFQEANIGVLVPTQKWHCWFSPKVAHMARPKRLMSSHYDIFSCSLVFCH